MAIKTTNELNNWLPFICDYPNLKVMQDMDNGYLIDWHLTAAASSLTFIVLFEPYISTYNVPR